MVYPIITTYCCRVKAKAARAFDRHIPNTDINTCLKTRNFCFMFYLCVFGPYRILSNYEQTEKVACKRLLITQVNEGRLNHTIKAHGFKNSFAQQTRKIKQNL